MRFNLKGAEMDDKIVRLSAAQTAAALARVAPCAGGFRYWTKDNSAPVYPLRADAERASIQEWRDNLNPPEVPQ